MAMLFWYLAAGTSIWLIAVGEVRFLNVYSAVFASLLFIALWPMMLLFSLRR